SWTTSHRGRCVLLLQVSGLLVDEGLVKAGRGFHLGAMSMAHGDPLLSLGVPVPDRSTFAPQDPADTFGGPRQGKAAAAGDELILGCWAMRANARDQSPGGRIAGGKGFLGRFLHHVASSIRVVQHVGVALRSCRAVKHGRHGAKTGNPLWISF